MFIESTFTPVAECIDTVADMAGRFFGLDTEQISNMVRPIFRTTC